LAHQGDARSTLDFARAKGVFRFQTSDGSKLHAITQEVLMFSTERELKLKYDVSGLEISETGNYLLRRQYRIGIVRAAPEVYFCKEWVDSFPVHED
jgi:hypothetical protein